ncbi:Protein of unknown function [Bacillus wiedmannii]|nr:Protein of unknown function [Bacillus wiedmannii]
MDLPKRKMKNPIVSMV